MTNIAVLQENFAKSKLLYAYHYNCIVAGRPQNSEITRNVDKILSENLCDLKVSEN